MYMCVCVCVCVCLEYLPMVPLHFAVLLAVLQDFRLLLPYISGLDLGCCTVFCVLYFFGTVF